MDKSLIKKLLICGIILLLFGVNYGAGVANSTGYKSNSSSNNKSASSSYSTTDWWAMISHDPEHTGYSTSSAPNISMPLWCSVTNKTIGTSSPAVVDGKLYIGTWDFRNSSNTPLQRKFNNGTFPFTQLLSDQHPMTTPRQSCGVLCLDATTGEQLWDTPINGLIYSSPAVAEGRVYIVTGGEEHASEWIYSLDANTGEELWCRSIGNPIYSSPIVALGNVYVLVFDWDELRGKVLCLDGDTGDEVWMYPLGVYEYSWYSTPAVYNEKVYITTYSEGDYNGHIYCLDAETGDLSWSVVEELFMPAYSSPCLSNGLLYVPGIGIIDSTEHGMIKWYNADTGGYIRSYDYGYEKYPYFSVLAVAYEKIYMIVFDYQTYTCSVRCIDAVNAGLVWEFSDNSIIDSSPTVADQKMFLGFRGGGIICFNASTGGILWMYVTESGVGSLCAIADGKVFFSCDSGNIYALGDVSVKIQSISGGFGISVVVKNMGGSDLTDVGWIASLDGGFVFPKAKSGVISTLAAGEETTVKFFVVGLGKTAITLKIGYYDTIMDSKTVNGTVFLFFVLGVK